MANGALRLRRGEEGKRVVDDEVRCSAAKDSPAKDEAQPDHPEAVIDFGDSTEAETWTRQAASSKVLSVERQPVLQNAFTLEKMYRLKQKTSFIGIVPSQWETPSRVSTTTAAGY